MPEPQTRLTGDDEPGVSDAELVQRILDKKDMRATGILFDRYQDLVNRRVRRTALCWGSAHEDIVNTVWESVFDGLHSLKERCKFKNWLLAIVFRTILREFRSTKKLRELQEFEDLDTSGDLPSPDERLESRKLVRRVRKALLKLSAKDREAYWLRFVWGLNLDEVVTEMGCSRSTVKRYIQRAQEKLQRLFERDPVLAARLHSLQQKERNGSG